MKEVLSAMNIFKTYSKSRDDVVILNNVSINVKKGEIIALMGPSGSGKTTLLNILGLLDRNYTGEIIIENQPIADCNSLDTFRSNKIGFVFQFHHLLPEFTVYENIEIPLLISGLEKKTSDIKKMLKHIGLSDRINHYPDEISGGERQRVAVLRALINDPAIILADEPTGNLDGGNSQLLLNLIVELKNDYNHSFIIATHDSSIKQIADRVLFLDKGKLIEGKK